MHEAPGWMFKKGPEPAPHRESSVRRCAASGAVHTHAQIPRQPPPNHTHTHTHTHTHRRMRHAKVFANAERALHIRGCQPGSSERGFCHSLHLPRNTLHAAAAASAKRHPRGTGACSSTQRVSVDWEGASLGSHATGNRAGAPGVSAAQKDCRTHTRLERVPGLRGAATS